MSKTCYRISIYGSIVYLEYESTKWTFPWRRCFWPTEVRCWRLVPGPKRHAFYHWHCWEFDPNNLQEFILHTIQKSPEPDIAPHQEFVKKYPNIQDYFDESKAYLEKLEEKKKPKVYKYLHITMLEQ